jgi:hypothetical protein
MSPAVTSGSGLPETLLSARVRLLFPYHKFHTHIALLNKLGDSFTLLCPRIARIPSVFCGLIVLHGFARERIGMPGTLLWEFLSCITNGVPFLGQTVTSSSSFFLLF